MRDGKLAGVILVGDTSDSHRYMDWLRTDADLTAQRRHLLFPPPAADAGLDIAQMAGQRDRLRLRRRDQGRDHPGDPRAGRQHAVAAEGGTRASTGCGSCTALCQDLLKAVAPEFEEETQEGALRAACRSRRTTCATSCAASS